MKLEAARIRTVFERALTLPPDERERWLTALGAAEPDLRRRVETLLRAHEQSDRWSTAAVNEQLADALEQMDDDAWCGRRLGAYRLIERLGRGGMGMVFRAIRDDDEYRHQVAIKVLPRQLTARALAVGARRERQMLADLQHPNIARLLDGGSDHRGQPYLVMEYVAGETITDYSDRHGLGLRARVELLLQLAAALSHAHQRDIAHCDIKPGNVLVTAEGQVKLLDFGIARWLHDQNEEATPLTPQYASPEQLAGEVPGTASDIYALGVVAHELLCGQRPVLAADGHPLAMSRLILKDELARQRGQGNAALLRRRLRGDLDCIVQHALRTLRSARYASIAALHDDLRRWLQRRPVLARQGGTGYRLAKWTRRQPWLATACAGLMMTAIAVFVWTLHSNDQLRAHQRAALAEHRQSEAAQQFLLNSMRAVESDRMEPDAVNAILTRGAELAGNQLAADPAVQSLVWLQHGRTQLELGHEDAARRWLQGALAAQRAGPASLAQASTHTELAHLAMRRDQASQIREHALAALTLRQQLRQPPHPETVINYRQLAYSAHLQGNYETALAYTEQAMRAAQRVPAAKLPIVARVLVDLAYWLTNVGRIEVAREVSEQALALYHDNDLAADSGYLDLQQSLGVIERLAGDYQKAGERFRANLRRRREWFGEHHPSVALSLNNLALTLTFQGRFDQAEPLYRQALEIRRRQFGDHHTLTVESVNNLAYLYFDQGRYEDAEPLFRQAWKTAPLAWGKDHSNLAIFDTNLAAVAYELDDLTTACRHASAATRRVARTLGRDHWRWAVASGLHGACLYRQGHHDTGSELLQQAVAQLERRLGSASSYTIEAHQRAARLGLGDNRQAAQQPKP